MAINVDFVALDVENANPDMASICQFGLVIVADGKVAYQSAGYINPEDYFHPINVNIHGITEEVVADAPTFAQILPDLHKILSGRIVATHTHFDRVSLQRACIRYGLKSPDCRWIDTACVARRAWPDRDSYSLPILARHFGIDFHHHQPDEDARAAAEILLRAIADRQMSAEEWFVRARQPITPRYTGKIIKEGNADGPLAGQVIVFTGALSITRREAAEIAAQAGCNVEAGVTKRTTIVVVGDQDIKVLAGHNKSTKHRKAEALITKGQEIRILGESDFKELVKIDN